MTRIPGFVLQAVEEDTFAVAVTPEASAVGTMIKLNSTAAFLFVNRRLANPVFVQKDPHHRVRVFPFYQMQVAK